MEWRQGQTGRIPFEVINWNPENGRETIGLLGFDPLCLWMKMAECMDIGVGEIVCGRARPRHDVYS